MNLISAAEADTSYDSVLEVELHRFLSPRGSSPDQSMKLFEDRRIA